MISRIKARSTNEPKNILEDEKSLKIHFFKIGFLIHLLLPPILPLGQLANIHGENLLSYYVQ